MNLKTFRKTLSNFGYEDEQISEILDSLLELYVKQFISKLAKPKYGALREDLSENVSILQAFKLCERDWVGKGFEIFYTTKSGEGLSLKALEERIEKDKVFEKLIEINLCGSFLILKYLEFMINHSEFVFPKRPEFRFIAGAEGVRELAKKIQNLLSEHGILSSTPSYTHSGVGKRVMVGPPNLYTFFEKKFLKLSEIRNFEKRFSEITKRFTIFRLLYNYSRYKREHLRKLWDQLPKRELEEVLSELKNLEIIKEDFRNLESFRILKVQSYKNYLEKNLYKDSLNEIRYILVSPGEEIRENSQAYVLLSRFEEELRDFIKRTLREAYGEEWYKVGVPDFVRRKLDERVEDARKRGRKLYSPLSYSDFSFYLSIILHKIKKGSNWELFEKHFVSIGWIKGRLIELAEIRNDIAHPKPLQSIQYRKLQLYIDEIMGRMDKIPQN